MHEAADGRRLIGKGVTPEAQDLFDALYKTCVHPYFVQLRSSSSVWLGTKHFHDRCAWCAMDFCRRLPCEWRGTTVVVGVVGQNEVRTTHSHFCKRSLCLLCLEPTTGLQVIVTPPYTPESATGGDDKSLAHVQKVVRCTAVASKLPFLPCWCPTIDNIDNNIAQQH